MFTELMPLLAERTVLITMARESDTSIRANGVPNRVMKKASEHVILPSTAPRDGERSRAVGAAKDLYHFFSMQCRDASPATAGLA